MLLVPCPHCGDRDESEFDYGGRAIDSPALQADLTQWHEAIHLPDSIESNVTEIWFHTAGCECWIKLQRNIHTHEFQNPVISNKGHT
ncbi:MAG: sarcosine oxidase subunit delta [Gammaproteobacteria bacterium]|nr:sarcosine oxidase subunit delta [Gammaproteobacteria bacterium]MCP4981730.1 sarcosine oxidase subunit delta [Gammaproteobacteria bacterium]